jgi:pimeloyl-ACP methyl ester carboxylesterase
MRLQPLLGEVTRTCSYDRAGYGFSRLGSNLPRDLNRAVADLEVLLRRSGERGPYILAGHSNGGLMIGAFANRNRERVAALMFFDAAVALPEDLSFAASDAEPLSESAKAHLEKIRGCLARARTGLVPAVGDLCVDPRWYSELPRDLASAEMANLAKLEYWRAYLSEAENNYASKLSEQARALMPHRWMDLPIRVFIASADRNRERAQQRQARVCEGAVDCRVESVPTANHLVHNEALSEVVETARQLVAKARKR